MLNRGYAYTTIISSKYDGRTLLSHLASLYPHSTPQAWQQSLTNREVTVNGITATGSESLTLGQTLVWNRPPWIEPDSPQHFEVLFNDPHLLAVNKPSGLPTLPGGGFMENTLLLHPESEPELENDLNKLEDCIRQLADEQQVCVRQFFLEEKCYREIAENTGFDMNKVKSYIQNGKRNLKICMERNE